MTMLLDYLENLYLPDDQAERHWNEIHSLGYLAEGLHFLNAQIKKIEESISARLDPGKIVSVIGNHPVLSGTPQGLVACAFHWYAVSVCNYARLVGWLAYAGDKNQATAYVQRVLPTVYVWRNKVAAHFAITDPRNEDTAPDLAKSVMFPVSFDDDAFFVGSMTLILSSSAGKSASRQDMKWSLTHIHRDLSTRFWAPSAGPQS